MNTHSEAIPGGEAFVEWLENINHSDGAGPLWARGPFSGPV
jgi:hypothetical protein